MSCALIVKPYEEKETTLARWAKIYDLVNEEKAIAKNRSELRGYQTLKKENLKNQIKKARRGSSDVLDLSRKTIYTPLDKFIVYLSDKWEMDFETYQVLEFIFRAAMESHERNLFDYSGEKYAAALKNLKGTPAEKYEKILNLIKRFSKESFFGLDDIRPTKMNHVNNVNLDLTEHLAEIQSVREKLNLALTLDSPLKDLAKSLEKTAKGLEDWAKGRVLGQEQNRQFLSFRDGQLVMNHRGFLYFKIYILVFMGTYGEFAQRVHRGRDLPIGQLAERKLKFESEKHFDFKITAEFLGGRERYAAEDRVAESISFDRGFLDDQLLDYIIERNSSMISGGELPFRFLRDFNNKKTA